MRPPLCKRMGGESSGYTLRNARTWRAAASADAAQLPAGDPHAAVEIRPSAARVSACPPALPDACNALDERVRGSGASFASDDDRGTSLSTEEDHRHEVCRLDALLGTGYTLGVSLAVSGCRGSGISFRDEQDSLLLGIGFLVDVSDDNGGEDL